MSSPESAVSEGDKRVVRDELLMDPPRWQWRGVATRRRTPPAPSPRSEPTTGARRTLEGRAVELLIKRLVDIAGAAAGLVMLLPLLVLLGVGTFLTLGRPIFFRQIRPGMKGKPFTPYKFRTMLSGAEKDEFRTTWLGRILRHASLDELPQLWNVLVGDMSLVGPRPLLMDYWHRYPPHIRRRHDVRPGVTGWCQVNGRNSLAWERKFAYDVEYVEKWSLALDIKILFMTFGKIVRRQGIDGPGNQWPVMLGYDITGPADAMERARILGEGRSSSALKPGTPSDDSRSTLQGDTFDATGASRMRGFEVHRHAQGRAPMHDQTRRPL